jgi:hypothetical protein
MHRKWYRGAALGIVLLSQASGICGDKNSDRLSSAGGIARERIAALRKVVTLFANPCLNQPDCEEGPVVASNLQAETSIAVDGTGQHIVIGFNDFRGFLANPATQPVSISGFFYSDDGGATFVDGGRLPTGPTTLIAGQQFPQVFGDPDVKYAGGCTFIYSSLVIRGLGASGLAMSLVIHRSTDCGHTWQGPFDVPPAINPNGRVDVNGDAQDSADKELADVDPDSNRYMLCWSNFTPVAVGGVEMSCAFSDNILAAVPTFSARRIVAAAAADGLGMTVRFAGNGSPNAYVAWSRFQGSFTRNIGFSRSTDNGTTWGAPVNLAANFLAMDYVLGNDRVNDIPALAVDKSPGPFAGNVYVVYSNNNSLDGADVAFQRSTNGGLTFSSPMVLNSRPGNDRAQWFPYVTVDQITGRVYVFYYDQGIDTTGDLTEVTYLYSDDGGTTWGRPAPLTDQPFKAGWGNDSAQPNLGDYNQAVAQSSTLFVSFAATTQPGFADGQPTTSLNTPDVVFKNVAGGSPAAPLRLGDVNVLDSGGNGNIDPSEDVNISIPLVNYVTNPLNATTVNGISAILSTTTPGVTVTQATATYPAIPPALTLPPTPPFVIHTAPSFVPGTPIQFKLSVSSAQGPVILTFTQTTGTPVYTTLLSENFDSVAPGALPSGWTAAHGGGANIVPWVTNNSFCGTSNKAFHQNANDGPANGDQARWERLFSPSFAVPANAEYVTIDFDVCYDTEDEPLFRILAYDGFFLRIADQTPGRTLRSILAEAFEQEFTTDGFEHYPKHFPRNDDANYFEDMSAWAGASNGVQHVHMRLPGMNGSVAQLRFEFTQDQIATCADVRPGHTCGVSVDNVVVRSVLSVAPLPAAIEVRSALARDPSNGDLVAALTLSNTGASTASGVTLSSVTLNGIAAAALPAVPNIAGGASFTVQVRFPGSAGAPGTAGLLRVAGGFTGGSFTSSQRLTVP